MRVSQDTDYELLYHGLRSLSENYPLEVLFEPLFYSKRKDNANFLNKISHK